MARCPQCPMEIWGGRACTFPCLLQDFFHFAKNHEICIKLWHIFLKGLFDKLLWTHFAKFLRTLFADWWIRCRAFLQARQHITSTFRGWEKSLLPIHLGWPSYFQLYEQMLKALKTKYPFFHVAFAMMKDKRGYQEGSYFKIRQRSENTSADFKYIAGKNTAVVAR